jgi:hypothetical protein
MEGQQQTGCELGRIALFREQGNKVEVAKEGHLVIYERICTALRTPVWANKQKNPIEAVYKEIRTGIDFIILADNTNSHIDVLKTITCAIQQKTEIQSLRVVINSDRIKTKEIIKFLEQENPPIEFFVDEVKLRTEDGKRISGDKAIDIAADKCKSTYYAVFNAGSHIPSTFVTDIDNAINKELQRFCLLEPNDNHNGLVVQQQLHRLLMGSRDVVLEEYKDGALIGDNILDKAIFFAKKNNQSHMIKKVKEICREM